MGLNNDTRRTKAGKLHTLARQLRTVGDDSRLGILCVLIARRSACVSEIAEAAGLSVAAASFHLQVLAKEKVLVPARRGKRIYYALSKENFVADLKRHICKYK